MFYPVRRRCVCDSRERPKTLTVSTLSYLSEGKTSKAKQGLSFDNVISFFFGGGGSLEMFCVSFLP